MAVQSGSSQTFLPSYQENYLKDLLANAAALGTEGGVQVPEYQVAGMTPLQKQAIQMGASGLGAYAPFFQSAANQMGTGAQTIGTGLGTIGQGAQTLAGSTGSFDPRSVSQFMDPYTEDVIRQSERDIDRLGTKQQQGVRDRAAAAGAFGGGRQAIGEAEVGRNVLDQQARTGAQLRSQGYQQAMGQAQAAFENQQRRGQLAAQNLANIGRTQTGIGQMFGQFDPIASGVTERDVSTLARIGATERGIGQADRNAEYQNLLASYNQPFKAMDFQSGLLGGFPTAQAGTGSYNPLLTGINSLFG